MSKKKSYTVLVPIAGTIWARVEADSKDDAADLAIERVGEYLAKMKLPEVVDTELQELDARMRIVEGNVCYAPTPRIDVEEEE